MAVTRFSLPQLARLIEEVQWGLAGERGEKRRQSPGATQSNASATQSNQRLANRRSPRLPSPGCTTFDTASLFEGVSKRRLGRLMPWAGLGLALATVEPKMTLALVLGGALGWGLWWFPKTEGTTNRSLAKLVRQRIKAVGFTKEQLQWGGAIASGGAMALSVYGSLVLWESFHNAWLVAGVVGQSGLTLSLALAWLNREQQRQETQGIERFHRLLESLLSSSGEQRSLLVQQLLWLGLKGRLDIYQQGMVLQALQGLFMAAGDSAEKEQLAQAIAQFKQLQTLTPTVRSPYALGSASLGKVEMPLAAGQQEQQSESVARPLKALEKFPTKPSAAQSENG